MASPIDPKTWKKAKDAYLGSSDSLAAIAMRYGISKRAVEQRASEEGWAALRQPKKVAAKPAAAAAPSDDAPPVRVTYPRQRGELDEIEIVESAISSLSVMLMGVNDRGEDVPVDTRGIGGIAGALVRLLEYRRKIKPPTAADLAEQAIALGLSPQEFTRELRERWPARA